MQSIHYVKSPEFQSHAGSIEAGVCGYVSKYITKVSIPRWFD